MRKILFIMFLGILSLWFVGCGQTQTNSNNTLEAIKQKGVVTIGVFSDKPPFGFINKDGKNDGFDVYLSKQIAKDLLGDENKVKFELVEAASRVEFLKSGKVDIIMANFTKTPEREAVVDFAAPYMKVALGVVSKTGEIKTIEDLK